MIGQIYYNAQSPIHWSLADYDCDYDTDATDLTLLINYIFEGGPAPGVCSWYCWDL